MGSDALEKRSRKDMMDNRRKTFLERYGVSHYAKTAEFAEKRANTCQQKYGVNNPFQDQDCIEKARNTCLEKYGSEIYAQSEIGRKTVTEAHKHELEYNGDFYTYDETKQFCAEHGLDYIGSGNHRKLVKSDKKMFHSIIKHTACLDICKVNKSDNVPIIARILFLRGDITDYKCPKCGTPYKWNFEHKKFLIRYSDEHYFYDRSLEHYIFLYGEQVGKEKYKKLQDTIKRNAELHHKMKVNSLEYYKKKYGEELGVKKFNDFISSHDFAGGYSKISQKFFDKLVKECKLDREKCFYATSPLKEKSITLNNDEMSILNKTFIKLDFCIGNKVIEFNGSYWHKDHDYDNKRNKIVESKGYEVLVVWDNDKEAFKKAKEFINQDRFKILTQSGYSTFAGLRQRTRKTLKVSFDTGYITVTPDHKFVVNNQEIMAKDLKVCDFLQSINGLVKVTNIAEDKTQKVYDVLETEDHTYVTNGVISHNCQFLGSSSTLINSKILAQMTPEDPQEIRDNKLKVFAYPKEGHSYIMAVDPAKDGPDGFAIQIVDITTINFEQVAVANLYVDYMLMPEWIVDWGKWYNNAFIIIEKNEGAGTFIANVLWQDYSYENLYFDKKKVPNKIALKKAPYPGFQTTSRTRKLILNNMRMFIEQNKFIIHDKETIEQFYHFILIDEKYQADDGYHDDLIMALAITFAPFCETKNFEDIKGLVDALYDRNQAHNGGSIQKFIPLGFFDSNDDDAVEGIKDRTMPNPFGIGGF